MAKVFKQTDITVTVEFGSYHYKEDNIIKDKTNQAKEFVQFLKDHRSQDSVNARISPEGKFVCSHCNCIWEWDNDPEGPNCCHQAIDEWELTKVKEETTA